MTRVLFVCVQNAGRSQIARRSTNGAAARPLGGSHPADAVHEVVVDALEEVGIDVSGRTPKALTATTSMGRPRRDDGLRRCLPRPSGQAVRRLEPRRPGRPLSRRRARVRATIEHRVDELPLYARTQPALISATPPSATATPAS